MATPEIAARLEELRAVVRSESMSYGELAELQALAKHIAPGDVELLEAAGVPEFPEDRFSILDAANETNRLDEIQAVIQSANYSGEPVPVVAVVDEEEGGIIAYALEPFAGRIVAALEAASGAVV